MTPEVLEEWINSDADLWGIFQPYYHLLSGRTVYGITDTIDTYAAPKLKGLCSFNCLSFWTIIGYFTSRRLWTSERGFFLTSNLRFERGMWISRRWEPICRYGWTGYSVKSQTWKPLAWKKYHLLSRLSLWTPLELGLPWRVKCYGVFSMYFRGLFYYICFIRLCRC